MHLRFHPSRKRRRMGIRLFEHRFSYQNPKSSHKGKHKQQYRRLDQCNRPNNLRYLSNKGILKNNEFLFYHSSVLLVKIEYKFEIFFRFRYFSLTKIISNAFEIRLSKIPFHRTFTRSCLLPSFSFQTFFLLIRILIDKNSLLSTT